MKSFSGVHKSNSSPNVFFELYIPDSRGADLADTRKVISKIQRVRKLGEKPVIEKTTFLGMEMQASSPCARGAGCGI